MMNMRNVSQVKGPNLFNRNGMRTDLSLGVGWELDLSGVRASGRPGPAEAARVFSIWSLWRRPITPVGGKTQCREECHTADY